MMLELNLIKVMTYRENYENWIHLLNPKTLSSESKLLLKDFKQYFDQKLDSTEITIQQLQEFFFIIQHPNLDEKQINSYKSIFDQLDKLEVGAKDCLSLIQSFEQQELYAELHNDLDNNLDITAVSSKIEKLKDRIEYIQGRAPDATEDMDLSLALEATSREKGLVWRLQCLRDLFNGGGLIKGDFGIIAGYVDSGKTSFLCSELTHMASQLEGDQWIAWLNTEGSWQQIIPRIYCAALNCTETDLRKFKDSAEDKYIKIMNGNKNRIRVLNYQRKSVKDVEKLIKRNPPSLIVFDLLDAVTGFDKLLGSEGNSAERYGALYQWARVIATEYCPVLAISQLNRNGNNEPYPAMTELSGSGEKKQGAATFQLMIGSLEGNNTERYLSCPKNKISSEKGWRRQVRFNPTRCRFED